VTAAPANPVQSLYVHVPFCAHKCPYCAFYSEPSSGDTINRYIAALTREMALVAEDLRPRTVFFGGGTPSLLNLKQWQRVFAAMERLQLLGAAEWTIECNPATVSLDKARLWREHGVNRVSMGVQSLDGALLDRLGRVHTREMVFRSFDILRRAGFDNLNLDLMFAIPGQSLAVWQATLDEVMAFGGEHLSSYEVTYEDDTPLLAELRAGEISLDEDLACDMYQALRDRSAECGFRQYEVSNFAKGTNQDGPDDLPARACRHNVNYWRGGAHYGLGPSAAGYVHGVRTRNWSNTVRYCEELERDRRAIESSEELPPVRRAGEIAAFGLRMNAGWPFAEFERTTGFDLRREWAGEMTQLVERGWATLEPDRFHLTFDGLRFADAAAELFLR
jgi:oxygen-independent coproporphyrinogen III oxidase